MAEDTSIPFPADDDVAWSRFVAKPLTQLDGISEVFWPEDEEHGSVEIELSPPKARTDSTHGSGSAKPRKKKTGQTDQKGSAKFVVTDLGWPSFVYFCRLMQRVDSFRLIHPLAALYDTPAFTVESLPMPDYRPFNGAAVEATLYFSELVPEVQQGTSKGAPVDTPEAQAYVDAAAQDDIEEEVARANALTRASVLETQADLGKRARNLPVQRGARKLSTYQGDVE